MTAPKPSSDNVNRRLSHLESQITGISTKVDAFERNLDRIGHGVEVLTTRLTEAGKPQWSVLASWAGIILTIVSMIGASLFFQISQQISAQTMLSSEQYDRAQERLSFHISENSKSDLFIDQRLRDLSKRIIEAGEDRWTEADHDKYAARVHEALKALDTTLQREMRILDDNVKQEIANLDTRLQREMDLKDAALAERVQAIRRELELQENGHSK